MSRAVSAGTRCLFTCLVWSVTVAPVIAQASGDGLRSSLRASGGPLGSEQGMSALASLASLEVSTAPLGTSTGGFTFTFDPLTRAWTRSAQSFGPSFSERSLTTGRAKFSVGFNWLHANYSSFAGQGLSDGEFRPARTIRGFTPAPTAAYSSIDVNLTTNTMVLFGHVGVTDRLDIGVAAPFVSVDLDADGGIFDASRNRLFSTAVSGSSSGIGDVAVFAKYQLLRSEEGGVALALETRLPTGDKEALRGLDVARTLTSLVWSKGGRLSPHFNAGYEFWSAAVPISSSGDVYVRSAVKYAGGFEFAATPRATVNVDVIGRYLRKGGKVDYQTFTLPGGAAIDALVAVPDGIHQYWIAPGAKWNVWRSLLVTGNVLVSLSKDGLRADFVPVFGLDWAF